MARYWRNSTSPAAQIVAAMAQTIGDGQRENDNILTATLASA